MAEKKTPQTIRRLNSSRITTLPVEGRKGAAPKWPLDTSSPAELKRWKLLWAKPQAALWEAMSLELEVAQFTRISVRSEEAGAPVTLLGEARRRADGLLLSPTSMFKTQVQLIDTETGTKAAITDIEAYRRLVGTNGEEQ